MTGKEKTAKCLRIAGFLGIAAVFGAAAGFYIADRGIRWFPTMFDILTLCTILSLLALISGKITDDSAWNKDTKKIRLRKRVKFALSIVFILVITHMISALMRQPSRLTVLSPKEFAQVFSHDKDLYYEYDKGMDNLITLLEQQDAIFDSENADVLSADQEKLLRNTWYMLFEYAFSLDQIRQFYEDWYRFDPSRAQRSYHIRSFMLALASETSLYEKSTRLVSLITRNPNAVKFLDAPQPDPIIGENSFSRLRQQLQGNRDYALIIAGKKYMLWLEKGLKGKQLAMDLGCEKLWNKIESEMNLIDQVSTLDLTKGSAKSDLEVFKKSIDRIWYPAQEGVARWMGNTRLQRVGKFLITVKQQLEMDRHMEPGDIMISRKNWFLSNVGLPGFWPHAILYLGSPDKLNAYFDSEEVNSYIKRVSGKDLSFVQFMADKYPNKWMRYTSGNDGDPYRVMEGIKHGIVLNTLKDACGDYMSVLRPRLDKVAKAQAVIEAFSHLDKPYDFNFDFATDHALVCTELVYRSYRQAEGKKGLKFNLVEIADRKTLPANEIVKLFASEYGKDDRQMDFVYFLDAVEKDQKAVLSNEQEFLKSHERLKWSFALE